MIKIISTILLVCLLHPSIFACSCKDIPTIEESIQNNDLIFEGKVLTYEIIEYFSNSVEKVIPMDSVKYKLATQYSGMSDFEKGTIMAKCRVLVQKLIKGTIATDTITIITGLGGGDCGYIFEASKNYLVYANVQSNERKAQGRDYFTTTICTRTKKYNKREARKVEKALV